MKNSINRKIYVPNVNPLPKTQLVHGYIKKDGTPVQAHWSKPKYRHNMNPLAK